MENYLHSFLSTTFFKISFKHSVASNFVSLLFALSLIFTFSFNSCSANELRKLLDKLGVRKATGVDNDTIEDAQKMAVGILALSLALLFNQSIFSLVLFQLNDSKPEWRQVLKRAKDKTFISPGRCRLFLLSLWWSKA